MKLDEFITRRVFVVAGVLLFGAVLVEAAAPCKRPVRAAPTSSATVKLRIRGFRNVKITRVEFENIRRFDLPGTGHDIKRAFSLKKELRENQRFSIELTMRNGESLLLDAQLKKTFFKQYPTMEAGGGIYKPQVTVKLLRRGRSYVWDVNVWGIR